MPIGRRLLPLCQMSRMYAGMELDFDVQVVLKKEEVPWCEIAGRPGRGAPARLEHLGAAAGRCERDAEEAVFRLEHV